MTLPATAYCARVAPDVLDRRQVTTIVPPQPHSGAWRRFQPADVVRLAVIGRLMTFGFTVAEAHEIVVQYVDRALLAVVSVCGDIPWFLLRSRLYDFQLVVSRERGGEMQLSGRCAQSAARSSASRRRQKGRRPGVLYESRARAHVRRPHRAGQRRRQSPAR